MPGLRIPLRASSSTSRPAVAPPAPASFSRHTRGLAAAPPPPACPQTTFRNSASSLFGVAAAQPIRSKHVNAEVQTPEVRLHGTSALNYSSSGSLHHHDPSSVCLSAMVHEFLEEEEEEVGARMSSSPPGCGRARCNCGDGVCSDESCLRIEPEDGAFAEVEHLYELLEGLTSCASKAELLLLMEVGKAVEEMTVGEGGTANLSGRSQFRRPIMKRLREMGYNAAACKSRWNHGDGLASGDYEYVDVMMEGKEGKEERMIVDIDFKAQFEIARPSSEYSRLLNLVPKVFVGRAQRVKQIVKMMSQAAKRSLQGQGLLLPPWRKSKYMQAKWLSPIYRRTTNIEPTWKQYKSFQISSTQDQEVLACDTRANKVEAANEDMFKFGMRGSKQEGSRAEAKRQIHMSSNKNLLESESIRDDQLSHGMSRREVSKEKVLGRGFEATGFLHNNRPFHDVCTAMCTSWQLPSLEDRPFLAPRVSALSIALQEPPPPPQKSSPTTISVVS